MRPEPRSRRVLGGGRRSPGAAFTLVELMVAIAVGLVVLNVAFAAFTLDMRFIHRIAVIGAENDVTRNQVLWALGKPAQGTAFPVGVQMEQIGAAATTYAGGDHYLVMTVADWSTAQGSHPPYPVCAITIPTTGH